MTIVLKKINLNQYRSQIESIIYGETPFGRTLAENICFKNKGIPKII
jgi:ABC-type bacteriocin/lantibiotic exporter with double-glycine peptidase domain